MAFELGHVTFLTNHSQSKQQKSCDSFGVNETDQ